MICLLYWAIAQNPGVLWLKNLNISFKLSRKHIIIIILFELCNSDYGNVYYIILKFKLIYLYAYTNLFCMLSVILNLDFHLFCYWHCFASFLDYTPNFANASYVFFSAHLDVLHLITITFTKFSKSISKYFLNYYNWG